MIKKRTFESGYYYHIYNKGKGGQEIFLRDQDYTRVIRCMVYHKRRFRGFRIVSYCFLPNHFHLIVYISKSNLELSKFIEKRIGDYARYFNRKYKIKNNITKTIKNRVRVFNSNFIAKKIDTHKRLSQCFVYVEQNTMIHNMVSHKLSGKYCSKPYVSDKIIEREKIKSYKEIDLIFFEDWEH